jgi:hypothetical protein
MSRRDSVKEILDAIPQEAKIILAVGITGALLVSAIAWPWAYSNVEYYNHFYKEETERKRLMMEYGYEEEPMHPNYIESPVMLKKKEEQIHD